MRPVADQDQTARIDLVDHVQLEEQRRVDSHQRHRPLEEQLARYREQLGPVDVGHDHPSVQWQVAQRASPHVTALVLREQNLPETVVERVRELVNADVRTILARMPLEQAMPGEREDANRPAVRRRVA